MFLLRLMHSGRDFAWLYDRQDQVCFLDGHVRAFEHLGGVPHRAIYDNLKPAVTKILVGSELDLSPRFVAIPRRPQRENSGEGRRRNRGGGPPARRRSASLSPRRSRNAD